MKICSNNVSQSLEKFYESVSHDNILRLANNTVCDSNHVLNSDIVVIKSEIQGLRFNKVSMSHFFVHHSVLKLSMEPKILSSVIVMFFYFILTPYILTHKSVPYVFKSGLLL